jgi:hypothetical protein
MATLRHTSWRVGALDVDTPVFGGDRITLVRHTSSIVWFSPSNYLTTTKERSALPDAYHVMRSIRSDEPETFLHESDDYCHTTPWA